MLNIPEGVSKDLVAELQKYQDQILILMQNHQILTERLEKNPEDDLIPKQISAVEDYLLQFGKKQTPIIEKIRAEIKQLPRDELSNGKDDREIKMETLEIEIEHQSVKEEPQVEPKPKLTVKEKMAKARMMRGKHKRKGNSRQSTPTPPLLSHEESTKDKSSDESGESEMSKYMYKADVTEVEKISLESTLSKLKDIEEVEECDNPVQYAAKELDQVDQRQFLISLGLFTSNDLNKHQDFGRETIEKRIQFRNLTYIPDFTEQKKQKASYNWLTSEFSSPPLLRTRRANMNRNNLIMEAARASRKRKQGSSSNANSAANSRATTPPSEVGISENELKSVEEVKTETENENEAKVRKLNQSFENLSSADKKNLSPPSAKQEEVESNGHNEEKKTLEKEIISESSPSLPQRVLPKRDRTLTEKQREKIQKSKTNAEKQLQKLEIRIQELEQSLGGSGGRFTVATRKERSRQGEKLQEKLELEQKKDKLIKNIKQFSQQLKSNVAS